MITGSYFIILGLELQGVKAVCVDTASRAVLPTSPRTQNQSPCQTEGSILLVCSTFLSFCQFFNPAAQPAPCAWLCLVLLEQDSPSVSPFRALTAELSSWFPVVAGTGTSWLERGASDFDNNLMFFQVWEVIVGICGPFHCLQSTSGLELELGWTTVGGREHSPLLRGISASNSTSTSSHTLFQADGCTRSSFFHLI